MYLVTFTHRLEVVFSKTAGNHTCVVEPGVPYVFSANQYHKVIESNTQIRGAVLRQSIYDTRIRPFVAEAEGRGRKVLFYTGAGGYGDQVMAWPVAKLLHDRGYEVHTLNDPGNNACWVFDWVKSSTPLPAPITAINQFDHLAIYELITNIDEHTDQLHPTDHLLNRMGIYPNSISPAQKSVRPVFSPETLKKVEEILAGRPCAVYQLSSSSVVRSLTPVLSRKLAVDLAQAFPQFHWFATYDAHNRPDYFAPLEPPVKNLEFRTFDKLHEFMAVASLAKLTVSIDSLLVHVAGVCGVPCVGLWGAVDPHKRVAYYKRHLAIWQRQACQIAPCYGGNPEAFPARCPAAGVCSVLEMDSRLVVKAARKLLR